MTDSQPGDPIPAHHAPPVPPSPPPAAPGAVAPGHPAPGYVSATAPGYTTPPGYPAQGYGAPGYGAPAMPPGYPAPGYAAPGYGPPVAPPRGLLPWALGLLVLFPFPFIGGVASGIAMATAGSASLRFGGQARENARAARNWGLTYLLVSTILLVSHFVILFVATANSSPQGFYPLGIAITLYLAVSIAHLVIIIIAMARVSSGKGMRTPFAIPFQRA